ncbi:MAG TPA: hypothetical protein VFK39_06930 [Gemmatimonadaceae bacterium]|jgi:hypothetical protein|nr:hypothetical protein [Gemmatimonadaceae bacterium]
MDKRDTQRNDAERRAREEERRDEEEYREEARHARPVSPEYQGEPLIFDELRDEPGPETAEERRARGPYAAPVEEPSTGTELVGEGVGGASGGLVGAALGSLAGPLGTAIGAIAGAVGGWWTGRAVVDAASGVSAEEERAWRDHYENSEQRLADRGYEQARPAYHIGRLARLNPEYEGRSFDEVDAELSRAWTRDLCSLYGEWPTVKDFVREGYVHRERHERLGGEPRTMTPTEAARDRLHSDDSAI